MEHKEFLPVLHYIRCTPHHPNSVDSNSNLIQSLQDCFPPLKKFSCRGGGSTARLGGRELTLLCGFNQYTLLQNRDTSGLLGTPLYCNLKLGGAMPPNAQVGGGGGGGGAAAPPAPPPPPVEPSLSWDTVI